MPPDFIKSVSLVLSYDSIFLLGILLFNSLKFLSMAPITESNANRTIKETNNRPDEWKIEQGMAASKLPIIDQTGKQAILIHPVAPRSMTKNTEAIESVEDLNKVFSREIPGWKG